LLAKCNKIELCKANKKGRTPFMLAVLNAHVETVDCLLDQKRATSGDLEKCLDIAAAQGNLEIFEKILHYAKSQLSPDAYHKAMVTAAEHGHPDCLGNTSIIIYFH
jgi:ankyrin repeat protein